MVKYVFNEFAIEWLKEHKFTDDEISEIEGVMNKIEIQEDKEMALQKYLKNSNPKVDAIISLLTSITDAEDRPICFEDNGLMDVPDEARNYFEHDLELEELDKFVDKVKKVKFARKFGYQKRRSEKKGERHPSV